MHRMESNHTISKLLATAPGKFGDLINELWAIGVILNFKGSTLLIIADSDVHSMASEIIRKYEEEGVDNGE